MKFLDKESKDKDIENALHFVNKNNIYFKDCGQTIELYILKAHLIIESAFNTFIESKLKRSSGVIESLSFSQKLKLIDGFDLIDQDTITGIKIINKIRNDYAHNLDYKIQDTILKQLERQIPKFSAVQKPIHTRVHIILSIFIIDTIFSLENRNSD